MMVLIPILFTTIVLIVSLNTSLGSYWHTFMDMYSDDNGVQFAQSMIYNYQQELWENNWGHCPEMDACQTEIRHSDEMTHLENKLSGLGYRFMITKNGESIYSNLSETDLETARSVAGDVMTGLFGGNEAFAVLMAATIGVPLYACGGGTIPLLQAWLMDGMSLGSAAAFMITGPATKITNLGALKIVLGIKRFALYLVYVMMFSFLSGLVVNVIYF